MKKRSTFPEWLKWTGLLFVLLGTPTGAYMAIDGRYARAAEVQSQFRQIDRTLKESQYHALRREEFEWLREGQHRRLSAPELKRLREVQDAIRRLERELGIGP